LGPFLIRPPQEARLSGLGNRMVDYVRNPPNTVKVQQVAITSVDVINHSAYGTANSGTPVPINTAYYVGAVQVTPTIGDQWMVQNINGEYRLLQRIPFNDPNQVAVVPTQGQHVVGSGQGPIELQAGPNDTINANAPLNTMSYTTVGLPDASTLPAGTQVYDTDLKKPIWTNGVYWHDATGVPVPFSVPLFGNGKLTATVHQKCPVGAHLSGRGSLTATAH
jgi:hypothetical protein